jgi:paraquat-inducible protein B
MRVPQLSVNFCKEDVSMASRNDYAVIGSFVLGAIVLLVTALLLFGSGVLLQDKARFIIHFQDAMKGLNTGAPVRYRGVAIGQVRSVVVHVTPDQWRSYNSVIIEINGRTLHLGETTKSLEKTMPELIQKGLRAQTRLDSLITASSYIEIVIREDTPITMRDDDDDQGLLEIPAIPSEMDRLDRALASINYDEMIIKVRSILDGLSATFSSNGLAQALTTLPATLAGAHGMATGITAQIDTTAGTLRSVAHEYSALAQTTLVVVAALSPATRGALADVSGAAQQISSAAATVERLLAEDSPQRAQLDATIRDLMASARELRDLLDYIDRHPEALLRGRRSNAE